VASAVGYLAAATVPLLKLPAFAAYVSAFVCAVAAAPDTSAPMLAGVALSTPAPFRMLALSGLTPPSTVDVAVGSV